MFEETHQLPEYGERPLKVFISSVVSEFEKERVRLVALIEDLQMTPLYCEDPFEDGNRQAPIPVCIGMVRDADVVIFLFGGDYAGREIPESELGPTEEEHVTSIELEKLSLYFVKSNVTKIQARMGQLREKVTDWEGGHWCRFFGDVDELIKQAPIDLARIKNEWDFSNEEKPGWAFIREVVEHSSDRDMTSDSSAKGRKLLPQLFGIEGLPSIPSFEIERLEWRAEVDLREQQAQLQRGLMSQESFNGWEELREKSVTTERYTQCIVTIRDLIEKYSGCAIHNVDFNGALRDWNGRECFGGIYGLKTLALGVFDNKPSRLKPFPEDE